MLYNHDFHRAHFFSPIEPKVEEQQDIMMETGKFKGLMG